MRDPSELADDPEPEPEQTPSSPSRGGLVGRLFNSNGGDSVGTIQQEYGVSKPAALVVRGLQKAADADGTPAVADLVLGGVLWAARQGDGAGETASEAMNGTADDGVRVAEGEP